MAMEEVTVFCAVWHKDPQRHALLARHRENLRRQTVPVRPLYVFDGGDTPPARLDGEVLRADSPLTIYQAWNLALAAVRTPLVMNLNLDDRLAPDAVEKMAGALRASGGMLIGGDWRICHSQEETDAVAPCFAAQALPLPGTWPPPPGIIARLGSSDAMRSTYGPATMWRMAAHMSVPRYPWRFINGEVIKSIADGLFWECLKQKGFRLDRLPLIIGNYHSHPADQAEHRYPSEGEWELAAAVGVNLI
jgi:hypothetical protein